MLPVEIGRALHVFVPSMRQALNISYTVATDSGHRSFRRSLKPLTPGFVGNTSTLCLSPHGSRVGLIFITRPHTLLPSPLPLGVGPALSRGLVALGAGKVAAADGPEVQGGAFSVGTANARSDGVRLDLHRSPPGNALGKGAGVLAA